MNPKKISYSQLAMYQTCPKKYEFCYVLKIPQKISKAASFGSVIHNTLYRFYQKILEQENTPSLFDEHQPDISLKALLSLYHKSWFSRGYSSKLEEEKRKKEGEDVLKRFFKKHGKNFGSPLYLEKSFALHLDAFIISGRIDRIDRMENRNNIVIPAKAGIYLDSPIQCVENRCIGESHEVPQFSSQQQETQMDSRLRGNDRKYCRIIDYKTGKLRSQESVDKDLQLSLYALAAEKCFGLKAESLSLYFLEHDLEIITSRSEEDLRKTELLIISFAEGIKNGVFEASPS
ncbi:PD-(D/E)XK nuclease family protein, partial [Candidatus Peregrinibacteria bacterium]|nr:PD-(D/E)XK nuclease family protein [Candidatus Peregrinibacteria bacterium]